MTCFEFKFQSFELIIDCVFRDDTKEDVFVHQVGGHCNTYGSCPHTQTVTNQTVKPHQLSDHHCYFSLALLGAVAVNGQSPVFD